MGGMSKVVGGGHAGVWVTIKSLLGLQSAVPVENEEEENETQDYVDKDASAATTTSLEKLNSSIVFQGRARSAFAGLGTERGWAERDMGGLKELKRILLDI